MARACVELKTNPRGTGRTKAPSGCGWPRILRSALVIGLGSTLGGCALAPGLYVDIDTPVRGPDGWPTERIVYDDYVLIPITPKTLKAQADNATRAGGATASPTGSGAGQTGDPRPISVASAALGGRGDNGTDTPQTGPDAYADWDAPDSTYSYRVQPQDVLNVIVWGHPELSILSARGGGGSSRDLIGHRVDPSGQIFYPFIGMVDVAGLTPMEIRRKLTRLLSEYIQNPQLDVQVTQFVSQEVRVTGEVNQPRRVPITDTPLRVLDAILASGGPTPNADQEEVVIRRDGEELQVSLLEIRDEGQYDQNILLQDEDIVHVSDARKKKVYVMGESNAIQPLIKGELSLAEAIQQSGGVPMGSSDGDRIFVIRGTEPERRPEVYHLAANTPASVLLMEGFQLQPLDIVYMSTPGSVRWNRALSQILPSASVLRQIENLTDN
jgi:polysaccharide export outer membrane protein